MATKEIVYGRLYELKDKQNVKPNRDRTAGLCVSWKASDSCFRYATNALFTRTWPQTVPLLVLTSWWLTISSCFGHSYFASTDPNSFPFSSDENFITAES